MAWQRKSEARENWQNGAGDILGRRATVRKSGKPANSQYLVRRYQFVKCVRDRNDFRAVSLVDERANGHKKEMYVGALVQSTFVCPRPSADHELDHGNQDTNNDSVDN